MVSYRDIIFYIYIVLESQTNLLAIPISVPIVWPRDKNPNYNQNLFSNKVNVFVNDNRAVQMGPAPFANRQHTENIYKQPTSEFNRLLFSKFFNFNNLNNQQQQQQQQNHQENIIDSVDFDDTPENLVNVGITPPVSSLTNDDYDNENEIATATTTTATTASTTTVRSAVRPLIQQVDEYNGNNNQNTNRRHGNRFRRKRPCIPVPFSSHGKQFNQRLDAANERTIFNLYYNDVTDNGGDGNGSNSPQYDSFGGYLCVPNYNGQNNNYVNHHNRPHRPNRPQHNSMMSNDNNNNGFAGLGFFGPGGLFDFTNNNNNNNNNNNAGSSSGSAVLADSVDDTVKPVMEANVQDTIQNSQQFNWRPLVGGIANTVNGFIQQLANNPAQTMRRLNREVNSYLRPIIKHF